MTLRLWAVPSAVVLAVLVLSGCNGSGPASSPPATGEPTPTPTPASSVVAQGDPLPALPLACSDFFSEQEASTLLFTPVTLKVAETTTRSESDAAALQAGATRCIWGGNDRTDNSYDQSIVLDVLPDGAQAFDTNVWQKDDGAIVYPDGSTTSEYLCPTLDYGDARCFANVLVDGYWAHASVSAGTTDFTPSRDEIESHLRAVVDRLTSAIGSAGEQRPAWIPPTGVLAGGVCGGEKLGDTSTVASVAVDRSGMLECEVAQGRVSVLPAGAWAFPGILSYGSPSWAIRTLTTTDVAGADATAWGCSVGCYAVFSIGGSLVSLYDGDTYDGGEFTPKLAQFVADVVAAG